MTDSVIKYVGVDGCKAGWIGVGLDDGDGTRVKVREKFSEILECFGDACLIIVDMPIGLPEGAAPAYRPGDYEAREKLEERKSSVFTVPSRGFVTEFKNSESGGKPWAYGDANEWIRGESQDAKLISQQAFHIVKKIVEVDDALSSRDQTALPKVREAHPEICFWALNDENVMSNSKRDGWGFVERFRVVKRLIPDTDVDGVFKEVRREYSNSKVGGDDVLDALALAITAKIVTQNPGRLGTLPKDSPDSVGEMVYAKTNDTESAARSAK